MKIISISLPLTLLLSACAVTPIADIGFPTPTTLSGTIHQIEDDSFILRDATGDIEVEVEQMSVMHRLRNGDKVLVKGVLDEDDSVGKDHVVAKEFDAYAIILSNGEELALVPYRRM